MSGRTYRSTPTPEFAKRAETADNDGSSTVEYDGSELVIDYIRMYDTYDDEGKDYSDVNTVHMLKDLLIGDINRLASDIAHGVYVTNGDSDIQYRD